MSPILGGPTERIETLAYSPGLQGGTDLEAATKTISNTSEPGTADYTSVHTIDAPIDARIAVLRGCMRLSITVDSVAGGCTTLNYRIKRGGASVATGSFAVAAAPVTGLISWDITSLITGAQTNTLFLWVNVGSCVISVVMLWTAVGSMQASAGSPCLSLTHTGLVDLRGYGERLGTGTYSQRLATTPAWPTSTDVIIASSGLTALTIGATAIWLTPRFSSGVVYLYAFGSSVATDLIYISAFGVGLRSIG